MVTGHQPLSNPPAIGPGQT